MKAKIDGSELNWYRCTWGRLATPWRHVGLTWGCPPAIHLPTLACTQLFTAGLGLVGSNTGSQQGDAAGSCRPPSQHEQGSRTASQGRNVWSNHCWFTLFSNISAVCLFICIGCVYMQCIEIEILHACISICICLYMDRYPFLLTHNNTTC